MTFPTTVLLKALAFIYFASSYKSLPLAYYIRFYSLLVRVLVIPRIKNKLFNTPIPHASQWPLQSLAHKRQLPTKKPQTEGGSHAGNDTAAADAAADAAAQSEREDEGTLAAFRPFVLSTYNSPFECDMFLHKSNSTYFTELDIARTELMTTLFRDLIYHVYDTTSRFVYVPVAAVQGTFLKEIKPYQRYEIVSRVLSWDDKWLFILSKFLIRDKKSATKDGKRTSCLAVTKYIIKDGRVTIAPAEALQKCGIWSTRAEELARENYALIDEFTDVQQLDELDLFLGERGKQEQGESQKEK